MGAFAGPASDSLAAPNRRDPTLAFVESASDSPEALNGWDPMVEFAESASFFTNRPTHPR
jgi:hypothetical protein